MENFKLPHNHGNNTEVDIIKKDIDDIAKFEEVANVFKQLSDASRIRIFWLLCHREECVINISEFVAMSSPAVSHHLRSLKESGLIKSRRFGKEVYYSVAENDAANVLHKAIEDIMDITCP
ncbi:metalloregulator ArsR/SmtB family transcription factor [Peptoniphilus sp. GNH]|nr:HTH-type transcriptional repressor CzrA family protein [Clostridiales bacterium KA00134]UHR03510.1 metalloregulator ArsR/SmtB family transcription factor [Peptoniphilus sp. GNH]